jgi:hypothetical protein
MSSRAQVYKAPGVRVSDCGPSINGEQGSISMQTERYLQTASAERLPEEDRGI